MAEPPIRPAMKLKLNSKSSATQQTSEASTPQSAGPKLKIKFGGASTAPAESPTPAAEAKKGKRKYTKKQKPDEKADSPAASKKRPRADKDDEGTPAKRPAKGAKAPKKDGKDSKTVSVQPPALRLSTGHRPSLPKLKLKSATAHTPRLKVKHHGLPPPRPPGVGYDSEAEDVEIDPAIEHQFVLRMQPGEDCDYLRKAVEEKKVGLPKKDGGADVMMRFFDREGRRAMVTIRGRHYAAALVDLPCIIEGMKSWDKRGWWKSADICQMLLVLGQVPTEEAARAHALPKEIDETTWQYPHGLTPPMHWVRKRRFRKRVSYRTIEAVEEEVERLLAEDEQARARGGTTEYSVLDLNRLRDESEDADGVDDEEPYEENGEPIGDAYYEGEDDDEMARMMEAELGGGDEEEALEPGSSNAELTPNPGAGASHSGAGATPSSNAIETEETSDEDDVDEDDVDEDTLRAQQESQQIREEIVDLQKEIQRVKAQLSSQSNPLLKNRLQARISSMQGDLELKKASIGEE